jgi:hypothetical protein
MKDTQFNIGDIIFNKSQSFKPLIVQKVEGVGTPSSLKSIMCINAEGRLREYFIQDLVDLEGLKRELVKKVSNKIQEYKDTISLIESL